MSNRAFTLVETLIAVSVVTIAIVGPMLTASRTLIAAYTARDQLTASYLAQEGVEFVRTMRDAMYLADYQAYPSDPTLAYDAFCDFWNANPGSSSTGCGNPPGSVPIPGGTGASIATCLGAGDGTTQCQLNDPLATWGTGAVGTTNTTLALCGSSCTPLSLPSSGRYVVGQTPLTPFTRSIKLYKIGTEIEIVVTVSWSEHGIPYSTVITDYLSPWQ